MINREHDLPITKQAQVRRISRGSVYYLTRPMPEADLAIMRRLDRLHLEFPFAGSRMLQGLLVAEGCKIGRSSRQDADAADGDRGALSPSAHNQARARPQDLPISTARCSDHATEPGLGDGHHLYPDGARLRLSGLRVMGLSAQRPTYGPDPDMNLIQIPPADHSRIERGTCTYPAAA